MQVADALQHPVDLAHLGLEPADSQVRSLLAGTPLFRSPVRPPLTAILRSSAGSRSPSTR